MNLHMQVKPAGTPTWTDLTVPDAQKARDFYHAVFGWQYDVGPAEFGGYTTARSGQYSVAGIVGSQEGMPPMPSAWGLYFATNNIDADVARAEKLGAKVLYPTMKVGMFGSMATLHDPTGAQFSLWQGEQHVGWQVNDDFGATTWYEVYSTDAKRARDFYSEFLQVGIDPMPGGMEYYVLKRGETMLGGIMQIDPSWGNMPSHWMIYFSVTNTDASVATILKNGGKVMGNVDDSPFGRLAAVMDNQGAMFKVIQPPQG